MKKITLALVLVSLLVLGLVSAASKGGVPALWDAIDRLSDRVFFLEQGNVNNSSQGLLQRIIQLENKVNSLNMQIQDLQNDMDQIRNLPIDIGNSDPDFGSFVSITPSLLSFGDYLDGIVLGDIIILTEHEPNLPFQDSFVNCNIGNSIFVNDRSNESRGLTRNYTKYTNITVMSQYQNWTAVRNGNFSCVPTVTGVAIHYWNKTLPSLARNSSLFNISNTLHRLMKTSRNGTNLNGFLVGLTRWINSTKYAPNVTLTIRGSSVAGNSSFIGNGVNITIITGTGDPYNPLTIEMIMEEFFTKNEFVILVIDVPYGSHAVAIHSMSNTPNSDGTYDVALMDPATGEIIETVIYPDGNICTEWEGDRCRTITTLHDIWSISLKDT